MDSARILATAAGLLLLNAGCGPSYCDPYYDPYCGYGVPVDYVGVGLDPYGYCADPVFCGCVDVYSCLTIGSTLAGASPATAGSCTASDATCTLQTTGTSVNQALESVLMPVDTLLAAHATRYGDVTVFGPVDAGPPGAHGTPAASFRLSVRHASGKSAWKLEAKPLDAAAGWVQVFTGSITPSGQPRRGHGTLGVDLNALAGVNPSAYLGGGKLLGAFANDGVQKATAYQLSGFHVSTEPASQGVLTSSTSPDGHVTTALADGGGPPIQAEATARPLSGSSGGTEKTPLDPGTPPASMPDPGF